MSFKLSSLAYMLAESFDRSFKLYLEAIVR